MTRSAARPVQIGCGGGQSIGPSPRESSKGMSITNGTPRLASLDYETVKPVGQGAGSTIYQVRELRTGRSFALKVVLSAEDEQGIYLNQARHEFQVARMLNHPGVLKIHDLRERKEWLFWTKSLELLMEYVDGPTLEEWKSPTFADLVRTFCATADAMMHLHRRGVYHGDVKPSNVMVTRSGSAKLIDFGTSWIKGQDKARVQGTPHFMAPEQARNRIVDERTDLYNFGATMYKMFTGEYANLGIPGLDEIKLHRSRRVAPMDANPEVPGTLSEAILACLESNPDKRPAGMFEVKHQLDAVARHLGLESVRAGEMES